MCLHKLLVLEVITTTTTAKQNTETLTHKAAEKAKTVHGEIFHLFFRLLIGSQRISG